MSQDSSPSNSGFIISVAELRTICTRILDHLEQVHGSEVQLEHDYYWEVLSANRYDLGKVPGADQLGLGQLFEEWKDLRRLLGPERDPDFVDLVWLGSALKDVGESVRSSK